MLSHRHEEDKNKVNKVFNNNNSGTNKTQQTPNETKTFDTIKNNSSTNNRKPIDFSSLDKDTEDDYSNNKKDHGKQTIENYEIAHTNNSNGTKNRHAVDDGDDEFNTNNQGNNHNAHDDSDFKHLIQRHNLEKQAVNAFHNY